MKTVFGEFSEDEQVRVAPGLGTAKSKCAPTPRTRFEGVFNTNNLKYTRTRVRIHYECVLPTTTVAFLYRLGENLPFGIFLERFPRPSYHYRSLQG